MRLYHRRRLLNQAASDAGVAARSVLQSAEALEEQATLLNGEVGGFVASLRAA